jgi:ketosteroid isomerase-like protein
LITVMTTYGRSDMPATKEFAMARTPEEVFQHHAQALGAGDLDEIVADYSDDAVFITPAGVRHGKTASGPRSRNCSRTSRTRSGS